MLNPGDIVGPYEIRGFLGQGGMGEVYQAFDPRLERTVALKVIHVPDDPEADGAERRAEQFAARLLREARAVASLSHPNVVGIFDVGESDGRLYLAMEYVVGATVRTLLADPGFPSRVSVSGRLRWLVDVARALESAHRAGLVHRDVKPENVMVREDGTIKVLDFGIARRAVSDRPEEQYAIDTVTGGESIAGTPVYMAPEQIRRSEVDARSDQFAWGVLAYELLSGHRPWADGKDMLSTVAKILTEPPPPLRGAKNGDFDTSDVPVQVEETILRTLSKDRDARFASMADVASMIEPYAANIASGDRVKITPSDSTAFAATTRLPTSVSPPGKKRSRERKRRREKSPAWKLALPLVLVGALGATVALVRRRVPTTATTRPLTSVPEAEAAYKQAMSSWHDGATSKARAGLARAVELDPSFAAAHLELAIQSAHEDPTAAQAAFQNAFEYRHLLVPRDATLLNASEPYVRPSPDLGEWETRLTAAIFQFPRDAELQLYLGRARERQGDDEGASAAYRAAERLDPAFIPALAAIAGIEHTLGHETEALAAADRCIKRSPVASTCVEARYRILFDTGECSRARDQAIDWRTLDPSSPAASSALARALFAVGAPRPSVEEAMARGWSLLPENGRKLAESWDRMQLAISAGELARAEELARTYESALPPDADRYDHARPARARVNVLLESERFADAANAARDFLDRVDAWAPYPFAPDTTIAFYEPLFRAGKINRAQLQGARATWVQLERKRLPGRDPAAANSAWVAWASVWGSFAETKEEALEAIAQLPSEVSLPAGNRSGLALDFALGKVYALGARPAEALERLQHVVVTCATLDEAMLVLRARYYEALAYEAKGEIGRARVLYTQVVDAWPKTTTSRTVRAAQKRLDALAK